MSFIPIPCPPGGGDSGGPDIEQIGLLCDVLNGEIVGTAIAVYEYDNEGNPVGPPTFVDPITGDPYVPQGTLTVCPEGSVQEFTLCDIMPDGTSVQFIRKLIQGPTGNVLAVEDMLLDGSVYEPIGTVALCDPYSTCTPDSNLDLGADCGPGESPTQATIEADQTNPLANSVFVDDATADPLCGGTWANPAAALSPPFPVEETFRNATFDQPGPVLQGNGPTSAPPTFPLLTADPANTGEGNPAIPPDAAGAGWLRMSDLDSGTNGLWQVPSAFSTADGMTAAITHASHDGTTPGGDGMTFVFTDGSVAPQAIPVGGFGNLGLQNWQGGYVAVVLDEYGQSCTCSQAIQGNVDANPGPCGFCTNTISIQLAGSLRTGASCQCCTIAQMSLAPKAANLTTRAQPLRLYVSIIEEAGQTYVSAGIDWNDGAGIIQYFDRVNVTACAGPAPATLRMAAAGLSGGSFRAVKEFRDATARPAGESHWRAFPIVTDPIEDCVTLVSLTGSVDVTFNSDTQTSGNGDPEAYFWLVNEATGTVIARAEKSSNPAQVGVTDTLTWNVDVAPADLVNLRVYVGSEARDQNGEYDTLWENLTIDATGAGCPAEQRRTLEISARCPIPVTIVGGDAEGGGGGTTVVNTPSTFEDATICITIGGNEQPGFRREVRSPDGNVEVTFLGIDGLPVTPESWRAGDCTVRDTEVQLVCDGGSSNTLQQILVFDQNGAVVDLVYYLLDGTGPVTPIGPLYEGGCCTPVDLGEVCYDSTGLPDFPLGGTRRAVGQRRCRTDDPVLFDTFWYDVETGIFLGGSGAMIFVDCPSENADVEYDCRIDNNGVRFRRAYVFTDSTGIPTVVGNFDTNGNVFVPAEPTVFCDAQTDPDAAHEVLCDSNGTQFIRVYFWIDQTGGAITGDFLLDGTTPFVPVGAVALCASDATTFDFEEEILCDNNGAFIRRYTYTDGVVTATTNFDLAGAAYVPVGPVVVCPTSSFDTEGICYTLTSTGTTIHTGWARHDDSLPPPGIAFFTNLGVPINPLADGFTQVPCASPAVPTTVNAQHRLIGDADAAWTVGTDVVGTLVSVAYTILSGSATVTDQSGTVAAGLPAGLSVSWSAEPDADTLQGPTSIDAIGGQVYVHWTQR